MCEVYTLEQDKNKNGIIDDDELTDEQKVLKERSKLNLKDINKYLSFHDGTGILSSLIDVFIKLLNPSHVPTITINKFKQFANLSALIFIEILKKNHEQNFIIRNTINFSVTNGTT